MKLDQLLQMLNSIQVLEGDDIDVSIKYEKSDNTVWVCDNPTLVMDKTKLFLSAVSEDILNYNKNNMEWSYNITDNELSIIDNRKYDGDEKQEPNPRKIVIKKAGI